MKTRSIVTAALLFFVLLSTAPLDQALASEGSNDTLPVVSITALNRDAQKRTAAKPRVVLAAADAPVFREADTLEPLATGEIPNYLRALAAMPKTVKPFADLVYAALYEGQVMPELKMAMGLRMAQINASPYVAAHMQRLLRASDRGRKLLAHMAASEGSTAPAETLALAYSESLTRNVNGVSDADFQKIRGRLMIRKSSN
ncbi:MAG: hypothetical protein WKF84_08470 [Pyrinomonadaceae bacterium]